MYASGFNDSGLYVGACRDCHALVQDALAERNALGWSSTNAGGHLIVEDSTFRNNSVGVAPDSEPDSDKPPPQDGACNAASNRSPLPTFSSTQINRCTIFRHNVIEGNGNISTLPTRTSWARLGARAWCSAATTRTWSRTTRFATTPRSACSCWSAPTRSRLSPTRCTSSPRAIACPNNHITGNAKISGTYDIGLEGGVFGTMNSVNNCFSGNTFATSSPADIEGTWGCQNATTPNGGDTLFNEILALVQQSGARHQRPQPAPRPQPTMPKPCQGVPRNSLCG